MERFLTFFWLLLIPTQLGRHFWLPESSIFGARIDYLSIIFYATDLVWVLWALNKLQITNYKLLITNLKLKTKKLFTFQNLILLLFVAVNVIVAEARWVAIYRWLRIFQWILTIYLVKNDKEKIKKYLEVIIPCWIIGESFLGVAQIVKGGSLNGIWWWLGERGFVYGGIGIAQISWLGESWIRAYGTFSHPNSLAGFLLLSWWGWRKLLITNYKLRIKEKKQIFKKIFYWVINWSAIMGILAAGSRTIWGITAILLLTEQLPITNYQLLISAKGGSSLGRKNKKFRRQLIGKILLGIGVLCLFLGVISVNYRISDFVGGWDVSGWEKREMLARAAVKMIKSSPLWGIGVGNFVKELPKFKSGNWFWLQPVHNLLLLAWSEIGLLGLILIVFNLKFLVSKLLKIKNWWLWMIVLVSGSVDHYWLTLPQNTWILAVFLGLI